MKIDFNLRLLLRAVVCTALVCLAVGTHFRGGSMSFHPAQGYSNNNREYIFQFRMGWRLSRFHCNEERIESERLMGESHQWKCEEGCEGIIGSTRIKCSEYNKGEDWMLGANAITKVFEKDGRVKISYSDCCWLTQMAVGSGGDYKLNLEFYVGIRSDTGRANSAPVTATSPMLTLRAGMKDVIRLLPIDSDNDRVRCVLGTTPDECGSICRLFKEFTLNEDTCELYYNPRSRTTGIVPIAVIMEDYHNVDGVFTIGEKAFGKNEALSRSPLQFLINLKSIRVKCFQKPSINTTLSSDQRYSIKVGQEISFTVDSRPCDPIASISEFIMIAPSGASKSAVARKDMNYLTDIKWTPNAEQIGVNLLCVTSRTFNGILSNKKCITVNVMPAIGYCRLIGGNQVVTFDERSFDNSGSCEYTLVDTLAESGLENFKVTARVEAPTSSSTPSIGITHLKILIGEVTVSITKEQEVFLDDLMTYLPIKLPSGLWVLNVGKKILVTTTSGIRITTDGFSVSIGLPTLFQNKIQGLCGNYNSLGSDDIYVNGQPSEENAFIDHHLADARCKETAKILFDSTCVFDNTSDAARRCSKITEVSGCFADCHRVIIPEVFYESCLAAICNTKDIFSTLDVQIRAYADACQSEGAKICDWRTELGISMECMPNSHYEECASLNMQTCADLERKVHSASEEGCTEGCVCDSGFILSGSSCVPASECGCMQGDQYYHKGFRFMNENCTEVCECVGINDLQCSIPEDDCLRNPEYCLKREDGYHDCQRVKQVRVTCKAVTDPHYGTFDGHSFDYQGGCAYVIAQSKPDSHVVPFKIVALNEKRDSAKNASHVKEVYVEIGKNLQLTFKQGPLVMVNDIYVSPGSVKDGARIRRIGRYLVADFDIGLLIRWDGDDRLRVSITTPTLRNEVEGLCGNFDDDPDNDFRMPNGQLEPDVTLFAQSWRSDKYSPPSCSESPQVPPLCPDEETLLKARADCRNLIDPDGPFANCSKNVDPVPSYNDCVFDHCATGGDPGMRERIYASYTQDCLESGANPIKKDEELTFHCPDNAVPSFCVSQCQPTCGDLDMSKCLQDIELLGTNCVEGCLCNEGYVLSGESCVPLDDCGCTIEGTYVQKGFQFRNENCTDICECVGDDAIECNPAEVCQKGYRCRMDPFGFKQCQEHVRRRATCKAVTDPHYMTFDKVPYDSMGTCAYIMVRSKATYSGTKFRVIAVNEQPEPHRIVSHVKEAHVEFGDDFKVSFTKNAVVQINGRTVLPGTNEGPVEIRKVGKFVLAVFGNGLTVKWDGVDRMRISAWAVLKNQVEGLCGDFNDDGDNDFMTPGGMVETNVDRFVESWKVLGYNAEGCPDRIPSINGPPCKDEEELDRAKEMCGTIIAKTGPFENCFTFEDPMPYFDKCVFDVCAYPNDTSIRDRNIDDYDYDCKDAGGNPKPWRVRNPEIRNITCDGTSSFYTVCMPPCQRTCTDIMGECINIEEEIGTACVEGCQCKPGYVLSGETCVPDSECGCVINGEYRQKGFSYLDNACKRECTCLGPDVTCEARTGCSRDEVCETDDDGQHKCLKRHEAWSVCKVLTGARYITPSNKHYSIISNCSYILAQTMKTFVGTEFSITVQHEKFKKRHVSWTSDITVKYGTEKEVSFSHGPVAKFNGRKVIPGTAIPGARIHYTGRYLVADFDFGLTIKYDGRNSFRIYIPKRLQDKFQGLCQFKPHDVDEDNVLKLMNTWLNTEADQCSHGVTTYGECNNKEEELAKYQTLCQPIIDAFDRFVPCHAAVDPQPFYDACVEDLCAWEGDEAMKEISFTSYTEACHDTGVQVGDWRKPNNLTFACPANSNYNRCLGPCMPSCGDIDGKGCSKTMCHEGCKCKPGFMYSGMECVENTNCGCLINNTYYTTGLRFRRNECSEVCECNGNNIMSCTAARSCPANSVCGTSADGFQRCIKPRRPRATCTAVTDPHFSTFDGSKFSYQGVCSYIFSRTKATSTMPAFSIIITNERSLPNKGISHVKEVRVLYDDHEMLFSGEPQIQVDGEFLNLGSSAFGASVRRAGRYMLASFNFGLIIRWDGVDRVRATIPGTYSGELEGLCGDFDNDLSNDYVHAETGQLTTDVKYFADSWMSTDYSPECVKMDIKSDFVSQFQCDQTTMFAQYGEECQVMLSDNSPFGSCHSTVDPTEAYNDCVYDLCALGGEVRLKDRIMSTYIDDCTEDGGEINTTEPWRVSANISSTPDCPPHSHFTSCASKCQPTCDDMEGARCERVMKESGDFCVEGCEPDDGYILSGDEFVHQESCGCLKDGKYFKHGETCLTENCQSSCTCDAGMITCVKHECGKDEECTLSTAGTKSCEPIDFAECTIWGDMRVESFSGDSLNDTSRVCTYTVAKTPDSDENAFWVQLGSSFSPSNSGSYIRFIRIRFPSWNDTIFAKEFILSRVNNEQMSYWKKINANGDVVGELQTIGDNTVFKGSSFEEIKFDGSSVTIKLPRRMLSKIKGLCKNTRENTESFEKSAIGACHEQPPKSSKCFPDPPAWNSEEKCKVLVDTNGVFGSCIPQLDMQFHYDNCLKTLCQSNIKSFALEEFVTSIARKCKQVNSMSCDWRKNSNFTKQCPINSHHVECMQSCQPICGEVDVEDEKCLSKGQSDCVCDKGYIKSGTDCIPISDCACKVNDGLTLPKGHKFRRSKCEESCTCAGNDIVHCEPAKECADQMQCVQTMGGFSSCEPKRKTGHCDAATGSHVNTFDQQIVRVSGECGYVFMKNACESDTIPPFDVTVYYYGPEKQREIDRVVVRYDNKTLLLLRGGAVLLNGHQVAQGSVIESLKVIQGQHTTVSFDFGLIIEWNGVSRVTLKASEQLSGCTHGLCGNFDHDSTNDFITPAGVKETDEVVFINSWNVPPKGEKCQLQPSYERKDVCADPMAAEKRCSELSSPTGKFAACHASVNPQPWFDDCMKLMCSGINRDEDVDNLFKGYAENCHKIGKVQLQWRTTDPVCKPNAHYTVCMNGCQPSCSDISSGRCFNEETSQATCVEGCECDDGFVLDQGRCVEKSECGCVDDTGIYYMDGFVGHTKECSLMCECNSGNFTCETTSCVSGQYCGRRAGIFGCHWTDECEYDNGGCSHGCKWSVDHAQCSCPPNHRLQVDKKTCIFDEDAQLSTIVEDSCTTTKKEEVKRWKEDTLNQLISSLGDYLGDVKNNLNPSTLSIGRVPKWSAWMDRDEPTGAGDDETLQKLIIEHPYTACAEPVAIDARLSDDRLATESGNVLRKFSPSQGLLCLNEDQPDGRRCEDFKVRFLCLN